MIQTVPICDHPGCRRIGDEKCCICDGDICHQHVKRRVSVGAAFAEISAPLAKTHQDFIDSFQTMGIVCSACSSELNIEHAVHRRMFEAFVAEMRAQATAKILEREAAVQK